MRQSKIKAEKREKKKRPKMKISGYSVFKIREIVLKKGKIRNKKESDTTN